MRPLSKAEKLRLKGTYTALLAKAETDAALKEALKGAVVALRGWLEHSYVGSVMRGVANLDAEEQRAFVAAVDELKEQYGVACA